MNRSKKTYFLLVAVLLIWGLIGYQMYLRWHPREATTVSTTPPTTFVPQKKVENSFYELKALYRDPFLGSYPKKKKSIRKRIVKSTAPVVFPSVVYKGVIGVGASKSYVLSINGRQEIMKQGETHQEVELIRANAQQITLKFQGVKKTIEL